MSFATCMPGGRAQKRGHAVGAWAVTCVRVTMFPCLICVGTGLCFWTVLCFWATSSWLISVFTGWLSCARWGFPGALPDSLSACMMAAREVSGLLIFCGTTPQPLGQPAWIWRHWIAGVTPWGVTPSS